MGGITLWLCCIRFLSLNKKLVNSCGGGGGGNIWVNHLAIWFHLGGAPCQVGTRLVKWAGLSSKSTCKFCCIWSDLGTILVAVPGVQFGTM